MQSNIKNCFTSRHTGGVIVNFDYSQLEVIALAVASECDALKADLRAGKDIHAENCMAVFNKVTPPLRTYIKRMTFQLQYGATAYGMAKSLNIPKSTCEQFIKTYYTRYPGVAKFHEWLINTCIKQAQRDPELSKELGYAVKSWILQAPTGRLYKFREYSMERTDFKTKQKKYVMEFKPTELKNYPVQGLATGDLVPIMVGQLYRFILDNWSKYARLINTVHDSIMLDVDRGSMPDDQFDDMMRDIKNFLESAPTLLNSIFKDLNWDVPTPVEAEHGESWGTQQKYNF